jgi:hypothetical protein
MPTVTLSPVFKQKFFDNSGIPLNGGKLFSYLAGTSTKTSTYSDAAGASLNANPVIMNFRGEADVFIEPNKGYKFVLAPSTDTDPPTNPIWSLDNVRSSQLITLYGGVDTGVTNAYVLTFTANFTAYTDGIVIYWIPSNTNGGASTINVNGLGAVSITNQDGSALTASQLVASQVAVIMYKGGAFLLLSSGIAPSLITGSFVPAWTGFGVSPPTCTIFYTKIAGLVILTFGATNTTGTSTATAMTITNLPSILRPQTDANPRFPCILTDNTAQAAGAFGFGATPGTLVFYKGTAPPDGAGFTAAGSKGFAPYTPLMYSIL